MSSPISENIKLHIQLNMASSQDDTVHETSHVPVPAQVESPIPSTANTQPEEYLNDYDDESDSHKDTASLPPNHRDILLWQFLRPGPVTPAAIAEACAVVDSIDPDSMPPCLDLSNESQGTTDFDDEDSIPDLVSEDDKGSIPDLVSEEESDGEHHDPPEADSGEGEGGYSIATILEDIEDIHAPLSQPSIDDALGLWDFIPSGAVTDDAVLTAKCRRGLARKYNMGDKLKFTWEHDGNLPATTTTALFEAGKIIPAFVNGRHVTFQKQDPISVTVNGQDQGFHLLDPSDITKGAFMDGELVSISVPPHFVLEEQEESKFRGAWRELSRKLDRVEALKEKRSAATLRCLEMHETRAKELEKQLAADKHEADESVHESFRMVEAEDLE